MCEDLFLSWQSDIILINGCDACVQEPRVTFTIQRKKTTAPWVKSLVTHWGNQSGLEDRGQSCGLGAEC